jgi:predicted dehydrogenase
MIYQGVKIGLVGCGNWGKNILRDLVRAGVRVSVAAPSETSRTVALSCGAVAAVSDFRQIANQDGYIVATPPSTHGTIVLALLDHGKPIFCEKPLTPYVEEAECIAEQGRGLVYVMHKWRYHAGIKLMGAFLRSGELGEIEAVRITRNTAGLPLENVDLVWHLLPHELSILLQWTGEVPAVRKALPLSRRNPELGVLLEFEGERNGRRWTAAVDYSTLHLEHRRSFLLVGTEATVQLSDGYASELFLRRGAPGSPANQLEKIPFENRMPLETELLAFLAFVCGGPPPMSHMDDELAIARRIHEANAYWRESWG